MYASIRFQMRHDGGVQEFIVIQQLTEHQGTLYIDSERARSMANELASTLGWDRLDDDDMDNAFFAPDL